MSKRSPKAIKRGDLPSRVSAPQSRHYLLQTGNYWKQFEKEERETRRKAEKAANERRKQEEELREAQRQQRKLNFLITQTELYAHFMHNKSLSSR